mmetsp:Transcript_6711/g.17122  ORF Transcript_6711/g.17122 Transcript_6711/m.17122 type:complete len:202 (-) Transcript_6711:2-607(-)
MPAMSGPPPAATSSMASRRVTISWLFRSISYSIRRVFSVDRCFSMSCILSACFSAWAAASTAVMLEAGRPLVTLESASLARAKAPCEAIWVSSAYILLAWTWCCPMVDCNSCCLMRHWCCSKDSSMLQERLYFTVPSIGGNCSRMRRHLRRASSELPATSPAPAAVAAAAASSIAAGSAIRSGGANCMATLLGARWQSALA